MARLFDLVRVRRPEHAPAFFYALGDTLVATDLEQASRIAYAGDKRWARVVTLQARPMRTPTQSRLAERWQRVFLSLPARLRARNGRRQKPKLS